MPDDQATLDALVAFMEHAKRQPWYGAQVHQEPQGLRPAWIAEQAVEPIEFGAMSDPVSQLAFMASPAMVRSIKALLEATATPGPRLGGIMAGERGNLGPPPLGPRGEPLPESVLRSPEGQLERYYHGTRRTYPDFEASKFGSGAGGDLYGPGIYMTDSPDVAAGYARVKSYATMPEDAAQVFKPGEIVQGYGGPDKVLQFDPGTGGHWRVQVVRVDKSGQPVSGERPRWHSTPPEFNAQQTRPVYADLKRPFDMDAPVSEQMATQLLSGTPGSSTESLSNMLGGYMRGRLGTGERRLEMRGADLYQLLTTRGFGGDKEAANAALQQAGYDGITHTGGAVTGGQPHKVAIAFSEQNVYPSFSIDAILQKLIQ